YDFLIVSRDFEKVHFLDRISLVLKKTMPDFGIDVLCYTPKEFEKKSKQLCIVQTAVKEGISF
ncbi:MAG: nucleotidyltransferase, partial [archaeon]